METLTKTPFFYLLANQNSETVTSEAVLTAAYKDFYNLIIRLCTAKSEDFPAFFTLNYTNIELIQLQLKYNSRTEKKCADHIFFTESITGIGTSVGMVA